LGRILLPKIHPQNVGHPTKFGSDWEEKFMRLLNENLKKNTKRINKKKPKSQTPNLILENPLLIKPSPGIIPSCP